MREKIEQCFERLQRLDIPPTKENMEKLLATLYDLRDVYNELTKGGGQDGGGPAADPEGRNGD